MHESRLAIIMGIYNYNSHWKNMDNHSKEKRFLHAFCVIFKFKTSYLWRQTKPRTFCLPPSNTSAPTSDRRAMAILATTTTSIHITQAWNNPIHDLCFCCLSLDNLEIGKHDISFFTLTGCWLSSIIFFFNLSTTTRKVYCKLYTVRILLFAFLFFYGTTAQQHK